MKNFYPFLFAILLSSTLSRVNSQTLYVPTSITGQIPAGAQSWFSPGCCDPGHIIDNSAMSGTGLAAIHEPCDDCCYFNEFAISFAYSPPQCQNPACPLPGYNINFMPGQTMNAVVVWNTCFLQPMQGHYANDANIYGFNMIITHSLGTATLNGQYFNNSLTDCTGQVKSFGATYTGVTQIRIVSTQANPFFYNMSAGGDRNIYISEVRGALLPILPVEVSNFTATSNDDNISLDWKISTESDNKLFIIDRSTDGGKTWSYFNSIQSVGNGTDHLYSTVDYDPIPGTMMAYKLTQMNLNGEKSELKSATTFYWGKDFVAIYPVPVVDKLNVKMIKGSNAPVHVAIYDMNGSLISEHDGEDLLIEDMSIDMASFEAGRYFVICSDGTGNIVKKAIVKE